MDQTPFSTSAPSLNFRVKIQYRQDGKEVTVTSKLQASNSADAAIKALASKKDEIPGECKIIIKQE